MRVRTPARGGFTLVELLVVVTIIAILMALTLGAITSSIEWVQQRNSNRAIQRLDERFGKRFEELSKIANSETPPDFCTNLAAGGPRQAERAKVIYLKYMIKWSFPMTYAEIDANWNFVRSLQGTDLRGRTGHKVAKVDALHTTLRQRRPAGGAVRPETEAGACLALIYETMGAVEEDFQADMRDTDGDGVMEVCDGWNTPLRFYRWPTAGGNVQRSFPSKANSDAQDPEQLLYNANWRATANASNFQREFHVVGARPVYAPLIIVSAGTDRRFGIRIPGATPDAMAINNAADFNDNVFSHRLRVALEGE